MRTIHLFLGFFALAPCFFGLCFLLGACGGDAAERNLPAYAGHATELFDDVIEPRAVGLELNVTSVPRSDPVLRERTQTGDAVVRVRVQTVTQAGTGRDMVHHLTLETLEQLAGERPPPHEFTVRLDQSSPSAGIVRSLETRLGGKTFIAFVKAFTAGGERQYHFHLASDTKDVRDAVTESVSMTDFK